MEQTWSEYIKRAMKEQGITQGELAEALNISRYQLRHMIFEQERIRLDQLAALVSILHLDLDEIIESRSEGHEDLLLEDDVQIRLSKITRSIPQKNRAQFLKAVKYLAQCFEDGE